MNKEKAIYWWGTQYGIFNFVCFLLLSLVFIYCGKSEIIQVTLYLVPILAIWNIHSVFRYKKLIKEGKLKMFGEK